VEDAIKEDRINQVQTSVTCSMAAAYLKTVHVAIFDMVPKYIILGLVQKVEF
jgi:hypothetical protein